MAKKKAVPFDYSLDFKKIDFRQQPQFYRIGKGEQGVLLVEPFKSEILPHWRFKTPEIARDSSEKIYQLYCQYREKGEFVGMDMARKFLQMGITRSRRYANHPSGRKWNKEHTEVLPSEQEDPIKAQSAVVFSHVWRKVKEDPEYIQMAHKHREEHESN